VDLLGLLAYAELLAFDRMASDAKLAPDLNRRALLSEMAGSEIASYRRLASRLTELGVDPAVAMAPFQVALDDYHDQTEPKDWLEALTKAYVGDSVADDFVREVAQLLGPPDRQFVLDVLHDSRYAEFAAGEIRTALDADPSVANRLSMWARRLVGEAIRQAQRVTAERQAFVEIMLRTGEGAGAGGDGAGGDGQADLAGVAAMLKRLTTAHTDRMSAVGLNN
jgi:hypothetical protein